MPELPPNAIPYGTLKKIALNAKSQSGKTGFDVVTRDGGMANGRDVDDQRIDLSTKSIIIATVPHRK